MNLSANIRSVGYRFGSVTEVLAKANPPKSGDDLAGVSARDAVERVAARAVLADLTLADLRANPVVPHEIDELTRMVESTLDEGAYSAVKHLSVGQFREWLLDPATTGPTLRAVSPGLTPEMAAGVCKLMSNLDLMTVGAKCEVVVRANNTLGLPGRLSSRLQPNHPTDDVDGILYSTREGLSFFGLASFFDHLPLTHPSNAPALHWLCGGDVRGAGVKANGAAANTRLR